MDDWEGFDPDSKHILQPEDYEPLPVAHWATSCEIQNHPWGLGLIHLNVRFPLMNALGAAFKVKCQDSDGNVTVVDGEYVIAKRRPPFSVTIATVLALCLNRLGIPRGVSRWLVPMVAQKLRNMSKCEVPYFGPMLTELLAVGYPHNDLPAGMSSMEWFRRRRVHGNVIDQLSNLVIYFDPDRHELTGELRVSKGVTLDRKTSYAWIRHCMCVHCAWRRLGFQGAGVVNVA